MRNFSTSHLGNRQLEGELMDDPALDEKSHQQALRGLQRINRVTNSTRMIWNSIRSRSQEMSRPMKVLDLACGGGDVLIDLWHRSQRAGVELELTGWDLSPTAIDVTNRSAKDRNVPIRTSTADALKDSFPEDQDVIFCSLFLHHLSNEDAKLLLSKMAAATNEMIIVSDLLRSQFGYSLAWFGTRLLSRSHIVHVDGPRSVEAAFALDEVSELTKECHLSEAVIKTFLPGRFLLEWSKKAGGTNG